MKRNRIRISRLTLLAILLSSLFLPYFETFNSAVIHSQNLVMSTRPNPQQSGFFGGGYFTTYNGFASPIALFNVVISILPVVYARKIYSSKRVLTLLLMLFILSNLLHVVHMIAAPLLLSPSDTLLIGYFLMNCAETGLFILAYRQNHQNRSKESEELLDS